jgi:flagellar biosynthesis/type III secretory pathway protein FliH
MKTLKLQLSSPIQSVRVANNSTGQKLGDPTSCLSKQEHPAGKITSLCSALHEAIMTLQKYHDELFLSHKEQIIRLSVEIAAKILVKDIHERTYQIENIITEALRTVDTS